METHSSWGASVLPQTTGRGGFKLDNLAIISQDSYVNHNQNAKAVFLTVTLRKSILTVLILQEYSFYLISLILPTSKKYRNINFLLSFLLTQFSLVPTSALPLRGFGPNFPSWRMRHP